MSKAKHTPAPWFVGGYIHDEEDPGSYPEWVVQHAMPEGDVSVAVCIHVADPEVQKANAMIIAAAPEMLEALRLMDEAYFNAGPAMTRENRANGIKALMKCRAAILKATGGAK